MLEQNNTQPDGSSRDGSQGAGKPASGLKPFDMSRSFEGAPKFIPVRSSQLPTPATPVSVAPPRGSTAAPVATGPANATATRLSDLVQRAEAALPKLESRLNDYYGSTERGAQLTSDLEERLKLGVRMLQAFDVQSARGESMASRAVEAIDEFERVVAGTLGDSQTTLRSEIDRIVAEKIEEIAKGLDAQRERFRQFESGAEQLAQEKLARLQGELDAQLGRLRRADLDAVQASDERLSAIRSLCDAQVDRLARASTDSVAATSAAGERVFAETEAHVARLTEAQRLIDDRERNLVERFDAELAARLDAVLARQGGFAAELEARIERAAAAAEERATRLAAEAIARLESELAWRVDRVKEVEARIEQAANTALAAVDSEFGQRLAHIDTMISRADAVTARTEQSLARMTEAGEMIERSERATAALAGLSAESLRLIESLAARVGDATALREVLGKLIHELSAAREVVHGDMRRMRDELGWLVQKSERLTGELVERADHAASTGESIRAITDAAQPVLADLSVWGPILRDPSPASVRPLTEAIASGVREELSSDMHGFASALRQLAVRADGAFRSVSIETEHLQAPAEHGGTHDNAAQHGFTHHASSHHASSHQRPEHHGLARQFERELAELGPVSTFRPDGAPVLHPVDPRIAVTGKPPSLTANRPLDLEA